jgi:hypothetical protein
MHWPHARESGVVMKCTIGIRAFFFKQVLEIEILVEMALG